MREMVYDDTRWVQKLQLIGCWYEITARATEEEVRKRSLRALHIQHDQELRRAGTEGVATNGAYGNSENQRKVSLHGAEDQSMAEISDGFDFIGLTPIQPEPLSTHQPLDAPAMLEVMARTQSIRGHARQEYGKVYRALNPFYRDALRSKHPSSARIFRTYRDPIQQAQMLAQLVRFSRSDATQGWQRRENKLVHMVRAFEEAVTREFEKGLRLKDVDGRMRKYAHVLVALNGGQRAVDKFISQNPLISESGKLGDPLDCISPNNPDHFFQEESNSFFSQLSAAFILQLETTDRVFPLSSKIVIALLWRVGEAVVGPYLDTLFKTTYERSAESYLRAVSGTYEHILRFAESLESKRPLDDGFSNAMDVMITDLFSLEIKRYLSEELACFKRKSEIEVNTWERQLSQQDASLESMYMLNVNRQADKRDFLSSFKKVVMMPVNVFPQFGNKVTTVKSLMNGDKRDFPPSPSQSSTRSGTPVPSHGSATAVSRSSTPVPEPPTTELAAKAAIMKSRLEGIRSLFSLEVALNLVHMAKAGIERVAIFASVRGRFETDARTQCESIFILLLRTLGTRHVRAGFDQAVEHLSKYNPRGATDQGQPGVAPLVVFLELVNVGDLIQQMLDVFYEQELVATRLTDRNDFLNPTTKEKKRFEQMLDERVAAGLNKGIEVLMAEVESICATTQNVEDYNPGATGVAISKIVDVRPSNTAVWVVEVLSAHTKMLVGSTDKSMLDVFNQEVGLRLFTALCKHLKRQRISVAGSIRLIR